MRDVGERGGVLTSYRRFARLACAVFLLVAAYTIAVKLPAGELYGDWLHTVLHLATAMVALAVSRARVRPMWPRAFTWGLLAVYGVLGALGWFVDGLVMHTPLRVPLASADNVFHLLLAAGALVTVLLASRRGNNSSDQAALTRR